MRSLMGWVSFELMVDEGGDAVWGLTPRPRPSLPPGIRLWPVGGPGRDV
jgi:hypothetical protein